MKYKVYNPKTKKAHWIDEDECGNAEGLSFLEYIKKHGHPVKNLTLEEEAERQKAYSELEEDDNTETKDI